MILNIKVRDKKWVSMGKYQYDMVITKNSKLNSYNQKCSARERKRHSLLCFLCFLLLLLLSLVHCQVLLLPALPPLLH